MGHEEHEPAGLVHVALLHVEPRRRARDRTTDCSDRLAFGPMGLGLHDLVVRLAPHARDELHRERVDRRRVGKALEAQRGLRARQFIHDALAISVPRRPHGFPHPVRPRHRVHLLRCVPQDAAFRRHTVDRTSFPVATGAPSGVPDDPARARVPRTPGAAGRCPPSRDRPSRRRHRVRRRRSRCSIESNCSNKRERVAGRHRRHLHGPLHALVNIPVEVRKVLLVDVHAADVLMVLADLDAEAAGHHLLQHREAEHVVGQAPVCIVGTHRHREMEMTLPEDGTGASWCRGSPCDRSRCPRR